METWMPAAFFAIAFIYSNAGFGGGSSYLALLALAGLPSDDLRTAGLLCNVTVVAIGTVLYARQKQFPPKAWPLLVLSVPFAFVGGRINLDDAVFFPLLAFALLVAGLALLWQTWRKAGAADVVERPGWFPFVSGGMIGGLSGLVGIGGGIFLSPLLHLLRWAKAVEIAAISSAFILVNSIAGLAGRAVSGAWSVPENLVWLLAAVAAGGFLGNTVSRKLANPRVIRTVTALLVLVVGIRLWLR